MPPSFFFFSLQICKQPSKKTAMLLAKLVNFYNFFFFLKNLTKAAVFSLKKYVFVIFSYTLYDCLHFFNIEWSNFVGLLFCFIFWLYNVTFDVTEERYLLTHECAHLFFLHFIYTLLCDTMKLCYLQLFTCLYIFLHFVEG